MANTGLAYSSLNTLLHHWLIKKQVFRQAVKDDPLLSALYGRFLKVGGIGQTDIVKLNMGDSYQTLAIAEAGSFQTHDEAGAPVVVDSSTIPNKTIVSRLSMTGTQKRALEKSPEKITGGMLNDVTNQFVDSLKMNLLRMAVNDGTGYLSHLYNATGSTTIYLREPDDSTTLPQRSWRWNFVYPNMNTDAITYSTCTIISSGAQNYISSVAPSDGTLVMDTSLDCSAGGIVMRYYTALTTAGTATSGGTVGTRQAVEPDGLSGMLFSGNTHNCGATVYYLGKNQSTYPRWTTQNFSAGDESLDVRKLDRAIYTAMSVPDYIITSPECMSQFRYEADAMKKLAVRDDATLGQPAVYYFGPKGWIKVVDSYFLGETKRCYVIDSSKFITKGTMLEPTPIRGKLEISQTSDVWFDDWMFEFENINVQRNAHCYITSLKEGF